MNPPTEQLVRASDGRLVALTHLTPVMRAPITRYGGQMPSLPSVNAQGPQRAVISAEQAFAQLGIDRSTGYKAIRNGTFPVPVIRVGRLIRVPVAPLRRLLETGEDDGPMEASG